MNRLAPSTQRAGHNSAASRNTPAAAPMAAAMAMERDMPAVPANGGASRFVGKFARTGRVDRSTCEDEALRSDQKFKHEEHEGHDDVRFVSFVLLTGRHRRVVVLQR